MSKKEIVKFLEQELENLKDIEQKYIENKELELGFDEVVDYE